MKTLRLSLVIAPIRVFLFYAFGRPDLEFSLPEIFAVVASVYILFPISGGRRDELDRKASSYLASM